MTYSSATDGAAPAPRRVGVRRSGARASQVVIPLVSLAVDALVVVASILIGARLRTTLRFPDGAGDLDVVVTSVGALIVLGWLVMLYLFGTYRAHQFSAGTDEYRNVFNASVVTAGLVGIVCYLNKYQLSRGFFVLAFVIGIPLLLLSRLLMRRVLHAARRNGRFQHRVLVAGDGLHIDEIGTVLGRESWLGYSVVGALRADGAAGITPEEATALGFAYVGRAAEAAEAAARMDADVIVVASGAFASPVELRRAQWALENEQVQVIVVPSVTDIASERVRVRPVAGLPLVHLERPRGAGAQRSAKRVFDVVGAATVLLLVSPVLAVVAALVKAGRDGPVLFRQVRVGRDGRPFGILKFRTMVVGAEAMLPQLAEHNESDGVLFKVAADPRVTRPGRWMRRFSIDELPQLLNVIRGDMSLVGPRPALPDEVSRYEVDVSRRLRVRPGITGLWQVSGRSTLSWEDTVRLDLYYVDNWSLLQDLAILARTAHAVLGRRGAY